MVVHLFNEFKIYTQTSETQGQTAYRQQWREMSCLAYWDESVTLEKVLNKNKGSNPFQWQNRKLYSSSPTIREQQLEERKFVIPQRKELKNWVRSSSNHNKEWKVFLHHGKKNSCPPFTKKKNSFNQAGTGAYPTKKSRSLKAALRTGISKYV